MTDEKREDAGTIKGEFDGKLFIQDPGILLNIQVPNPPVKIYLAGGMKGEWQWQDDVIHALKDYNVEFLDPRSHHLTAEEEYTAWDLAAVRDCQLLAGLMTIDNPSGWGLNLELGYAKALGKEIVLCHVDGYRDHRHKHFGMARQVADAYFEDFNTFIGYLRGRLHHVRV